MRAFLADMDHTDDDLRLFAIKLSNLIRRKKMMSRGIASEDALVDTVSQMSVLVATLTKKVNDQNINDIQQQFPWLQTKA